MDALTAALIAFLSIAAGTAARIADRRVVNARVPIVRAQGSRTSSRTMDGVSVRPLASS